MFPPYLTYLVLLIFPLRFITQKCYHYSPLYPPVSCFWSGIPVFYRSVFILFSRFFNFDLFMQFSIFFLMPFLFPLKAFTFFFLLNFSLISGPWSMGGHWIEYTFFLLFNFPSLLGNHLILLQIPAS